jgi:hypothetical protein
VAAAIAETVADGAGVVVVATATSQYFPRKI